MKTILLTGGTGFIGHHTVESFLKTKNDIQIIVLDGMSYAGNLERLHDIELFENWSHEGKIKFLSHDIRLPLTKDLVKKVGPVDYIIHMAAETHVDRSIKDPISFVQTNVVGTANMLEYARYIHKQGHLKLFMQISTDEVYGPARENQFHREDFDLMRPSNPYAATKAAAENLAYSYYVTYKIPIIITRTMNNFGERQHPEKYVMKALKELLSGKKVEVHGTPKNMGSRCWIHARNNANALIFLLENGKFGETYNITGKRLTNLEMAEKIARFANLPLDIRFVDFHKCRPGHDPHYALDGTKLAQLGWEAPLSLDESLEKTILWTLEHKKWLEL